MTMSDLIKTQSTPQFNWYTRWMFLGANGTPDNLIKEGSKQLDCIKISFKKGAKEITGHVAPDQARFGPEYFLAFMFPDFKSKILTRLLDAQKENGPTLFNLMGQCFQDVGLTEWMSVVAKQCPTESDPTKANFDECIEITLRQVPGSPMLVTS
jgi:hypothetical protein